MRAESDLSKGAGTVIEAAIGVLNKFLRGEMSAVETYRQALERLSVSASAPDLIECKGSHERRVELLTTQVYRLGGKPAETSGPWGGFAKLIEAGAKLFGEKSAIAALQEGEDHGLKLYRNNDDLDRLDLATRDFVMQSLLPEQERTHRIASALKHLPH